MTITPDDLIVFASRSGNVALLRERIASGGNLNYDNGAALKAAILAGHLHAIDLLIENGADVNAGPEGFGPLEVALRHPIPAIVYRLVCAGAKLRRTARPYYRQRLARCLEQAARPNNTIEPTR